MTQAGCSFSIWVLGANQAKRASNEQDASAEGFGFSQHLSDPAFSRIFSELSTLAESAVFGERGAYSVFLCSTQLWFFQFSVK